MDIFIASHDSRNFSFEAFGETEQDARAAFQRGLDEHARQYSFRIDRSWADEMMEGLKVRSVELGGAYRDNELLAAPIEQRQSPAHAKKAKRRLDAGPSR